MLRCQCNARQRLGHQDEPSPLMSRKLLAGHSPTRRASNRSSSFRSQTGKRLIGRILEETTAKLASRDPTQSGQSPHRHSFVGAEEYPVLQSLERARKGPSADGRIAAARDLLRQGCAVPEATQNRRGQRSAQWNSSMQRTSVTERLPSRESPRPTWPAPTATSQRPKA